jgi:hypothetical protein
MKTRFLHSAAGALYPFLGLLFFSLVLRLVFALSGLLFNTPTHVPLGKNGRLNLGGGMLNSIRVRLDISLSDTTIRLADGRSISWTTNPEEAITHTERGWIADRRRDLTRSPHADTVVTRILVFPPRRSHSFTYSSATVRPLNDAGEPGIAVITRLEQTEATLTLREGTPRDRLLVALPSVLRWSLFLVALYQVLGFLKLFRKGESLSEASFRRVRWLGYGFMAFALLPLIEYWTVSRLMDYAQLYRYSTLGTDVNSFSIWMYPISETRLDLLFAGILLLIVAAVFQRGYELQREAELTI